jgi:hypothetical protein
MKRVIRTGRLGAAGSSLGRCAKGAAGGGALRDYMA